MTDLFDEPRPPQPRPMPSQRQVARVELLDEAIASRKHWRRLAITLPVVGAVAVATAGALTFIPRDEPAAQRLSIRCYSSSDWSSKAEYGIIVGVRQGGGTFEFTDPIEACAEEFRGGFLHEGEPGAPPETGGAPTHPVPRLVACVLPSGQIAVFPSTTCQQLKLPDLTR